MDFIITQIIGGLGCATLAASYYKKEKKNILFMQIIAYIMFTIHYYLLSGLTGAICNFIGLLALVTIYIMEKNKWKNKNLISSFFIVLLFIINIISFQNIFSIFPMIASTIAIASFMMDNEDYIRGIGVISIICWLIYAVVYKSYVSIFFQVITLVGTLVAFAKNTTNSKFKIKE